MIKKLFVLLLVVIMLGLVTNIIPETWEVELIKPQEDTTPTMENMKKYVVKFDIGFFNGTYAVVLIARNETTRGKAKDLATVYVNIVRDKAIREEGAKAYLYNYRMFVFRENKEFLVTGYVDAYSSNYIWDADKRKTDKL